MIDRFQSFVIGITECYKSIQRIKSVEMTELGLKGPHLMCLFFLHRHPEGLTAAKLCRLCSDDKAAISRTIETLKKQGYIVTGEKKYRAAITLTESGAAAAERLNGVICQWVGFGGDGLTDDERVAFYRSLEKISGNLRTRLSTGTE